LGLGGLGTRENESASDQSFVAQTANENLPECATGAMVSPDILNVTWRLLLE